MIGQGLLYNRSSCRCYKMISRLMLSLSCHRCHSRRSRMLVVGVKEVLQLLLLLLLLLLLKLSIGMLIS